MVDYAKLAIQANTAEDANRATIQKRQNDQIAFFALLGAELQHEVHSANRSLKNTGLSPFNDLVFGQDFILLSRGNGQACRLTNVVEVQSGINVYITAEFPSKQADRVEDRTLYFVFDTKKTCWTVKKIKHFGDYVDMPNVGASQIAQSIVAMVVGARLVDQFGFKTEDWEWKLV
jgi:hypothetical protein